MGCGQRETIIPGSIDSGAFLKADSIEELAAFIGCDAATLQATVDLRSPDGTQPV